MRWAWSHGGPQPKPGWRFESVIITYGNVPKDEVWVLGAYNGKPPQHSIDTLEVRVREFNNNRNIGGVWTPPGQLLSNRGTENFTILGIVYRPAPAEINEYGDIHP